MCRTKSARPYLYLCFLLLCAVIVVACTNPAGSRLGSSSGSNPGNTDSAIPPAVSGISDVEDENLLEPPADEVENDTREYKLHLEGGLDPADDNSLYIRAIEESEWEWLTVTDASAGIVEVDSNGLPAGHDQPYDVSFYSSFNDDRDKDPDSGSTYDTPFVVRFTVKGPPSGE